MDEIIYPEDLQEERVLESEEDDLTEEIVEMGKESAFDEAREDALRDTFRPEQYGKILRRKVYGRKGNWWNGNHKRQLRVSFRVLV